MFSTDALDIINKIHELKTEKIQKMFQNANPERDEVKYTYNHVVKMAMQLVDESVKELMDYQIVKTMERIQRDEIKKEVGEKRISEIKTAREKMRQITIKV